MKSKPNIMEDLSSDEISDLSKKRTSTSKPRLILPPIKTNQSVASASTVSHATASFENDKIHFSLKSKTPFLTSITEIS
jgi:hypothetical protein